MNIPQLEDLGSLDGLRVLVRCDLNVPLMNGAIVNDIRIRSSLPTLNYLNDAGAKVTVCSHLGRPKGEYDSDLVIDPVALRLETLVPGISILENLRFNSGETLNEESFVSELINGQDCYVNDAFGSSHREHASIVGPPAYLPSVAGRLLFRELEVLQSLRKTTRRPFVAVLGGAKVSDKIGVIETLLEQVDELLIGGGMMFTFLAAQGCSIGDSLVDENLLEHCSKLLENSDQIRLPVDVTALDQDGVLHHPDQGGEVRQFGLSLPDGWKGVDIGPGSAAEFFDTIVEAGTVLWNGPMGVFEDKRFQSGTRTIADAVAQCQGFTVVGGGDSAASIVEFGFSDNIDYISTGGGATLEFIEKGDLPGVAALRNSVHLSANRGVPYE